MGTLRIWIKPSVRLTLSGLAWYGTPRHHNFQVLSALFPGGLWRRICRDENVYRCTAYILENRYAQKALHLSQAVSLLCAGLETPTLQGPLSWATSWSRVESIRGADAWRDPPRLQPLPSRKLRLCWRETGGEPAGVDGGDVDNEAASVWALEI